jgi:hypothetical protein
MYIYHLPDIARTLKNANTLPYDEAKRLEALDSYHILDTLEEKDYDDLTALAAAYQLQ